MGYYQIILYWQDDYIDYGEEDQNGVYICTDKQDQYSGSKVITISYWSILICLQFRIFRLK
jgi:hypothetical protein